jgi:protein-tyrosine-phosphatase
VLFMSVRDVGRSQMATGFLRRFAGDRALAWSGGTAPGLALDPVVVDVMREIGIGLGPQVPNAWTDDTVRAADVVVTMGGEACPVLPGKHYEDWVLAASHRSSLLEARIVRDQIGERVLHLAGELGITAA